MALKIQKSLIILLVVASLAACQADKDAPKPTVEISLPAPAPSHAGKKPLYCAAGHGSALFGRNWYDFRDTPFILYDHDRVAVKIARSRGAETMAIQGTLDSDGQKLIFCPKIKAAAGQRVSCTSFYALEDDLRDGIKRTFDIPNAIRGAEVTCSYDEAHLKPLATPAAGGN